MNSDALPLVTVVTVAYNSSRYIREAISSVLALNYGHFEYIISDDCSSDNTWDIINEYKDDRIRAFHHESNKGEYTNRNSAIRHARGKYLLFIDGDDYIYPFALDILVGYMEQFSSAAYAVMLPENKKIIFPVLLSPEIIYRSEFSEYSLINTALTHTFFRTTALLENSLFPTCYLSGDTYMRLKIALRQPCLLVNNSLTWWRHTKGQASEKLTASGRFELLLMSTELFADPECPLQDTDKQLFLRNSRIKIVRMIGKLLLTGNFEKAARVMSANNVSLKFLPSFFKRLALKDPFHSYSPESPLRMFVDDTR